MMGKADREILRISNLSDESIKLSRYFDFLVVAAAFLLFTGAIHLHVALTIGDWDMFIDWKDRQYWVLITPISMIVFPAAVQAIFWHFFRLPIGATLCAVVLLFGVWVARYFAWNMFGYFPITLGLPGIMIASCLALDAILLLTRNPIFTAIFGAPLFAMMMFPANWVAFAPFFMPVEHMGQLASLADMIGYVFPRSNTPEYIRIIERGTLRTYEGTAVWVSSFFAAFVCIFMYMLWWRIGLLFSTVRYLPNNKRVKAMMGLK